MKIGRSSIPVNVLTPYTLVGHCDDARWVSVSVLVSLMSNELAQSLKRIIAHTVVLVPHPRYRATGPVEPGSTSLPLRAAIYCRARWPAKKTECSCFAVFCALSRAALFAITLDNVWTGDRGDTHIVCVGCMSQKTSEFKKIWDRRFSSQVIELIVSTFVVHPVKGFRCSLAALGCAGPWTDKDALVCALDFHRAKLVALSWKSRIFL